MYDCDNLQVNMDNFMQVLEQAAYRDCIPLRGTFELTARCNFNCNMCYVHLNEEQIQKQGRELTNEEWLDIARQAKEAGMLYLTLTGGEVFARPGFKELYLALSEMGFLIQILSNGYLIDEKVMEWLSETPPHMLRFTLYGASDETYENVCGIKDGFTKVSHAIDLVRESDIPFYLVSTLVKENQHDFEAMCRLSEEKEVFLRASTAVIKSIRGVNRNIDEHRIDIEDAVNLERGELPSINNLLDVCGRYRKGFCITWNGNMQLCAFMNDSTISLIGQSFDEAWDRLIIELEKIKLPNECKDCKYSGFCTRCPGVLAAECGSCKQVDEEFCDKAKRLYQVFHKKKGEINEEVICGTEN